MVFGCPDLTESQRLECKELIKLRDEKNGKLMKEDNDQKTGVYGKMRGFC